MTFDPAVPLNSDSPSVFPAQNQTNMSRLKTLVSADHQFNNTAAANDGYHNLIHMTIQAPSGALASTGRFYSKTSAGRVHAFYMDSSGSEYQISPTMPIRAAVNFDNTGAIRGTAYNVSSVTKNGTGDFTVNFTTAMPNVNYVVQVTGMRNASDEVSVGCVTGTATYGNAVKVDSVDVQFFGSSDTLRDITAGFVTIFSVT